MIFLMLIWVIGVELTMGMMGIELTLTGLRHCQVGRAVTCQAAKLLTVSFLPNCKPYCMFPSIH